MDDLNVESLVQMGSGGTSGMITDNTETFKLGNLGSDRLCGLVVRVSGYRYRGPGFDPRRYQIF